MISDQVVFASHRDSRLDVVCSLRTFSWTKAKFTSPTGASRLAMSRVAALCRGVSEASLMEHQSC
jgi:hypothetical protein